MFTFNIIGLIVCLWLCLSLPYTVFPVKMAKLFDYNYGWKRLKHSFGLMLTMPLSSAIALAISRDVGYLNKGDVISFEKTEFFSLMICTWASLMLAYYFFFLRKYTKEKQEIDRKTSSIDLTNNKKTLDRKLYLTLVVFIIASIGEGFFQDLLYEPFIKPIMCQMISSFC